MKHPVNRKTMIIFDLMCPGVGHIVVGWWKSGLAGLFFFLGAVFALCLYTVVPFWRLLQAALNDSEMLPEDNFRPVPIFLSLGLSLLVWLVLFFDGLFRGRKTGSTGTERQ